MENLEITRTEPVYKPLHEMEGFVEMEVPFNLTGSRRVLVDRWRVAAVLEIHVGSGASDQRPRTFIMFATAVDADGDNNGIVVLGTVNEVARKLHILIPPQSRPATTEMEA